MCGSIYKLKLNDLPVYTREIDSKSWRTAVCYLTGITIIVDIKIAILMY